MIMRSRCVGMKVATIAGAVVAVVALAACGATAAPHASPTLEPTVSPSVASTAVPTDTPTPASTTTPVPPTPTPAPFTPPTVPPTLTALCAPSPMEFAWQVSFPEPESNYNVDLSFTAGASFTQEETSATQPYTFDTPNALGQQLILVRWDSFPAAGISSGTNADSDMCDPALLPPPTVLPLCEAASGGYDWQVRSSTQQVSWSIDLRYSLNGDWTYYASTSASFVFETPGADGKTLYVRWSFYPGAGTSTAHASTKSCT